MRTILAIPLLILLFLSPALAASGEKCELNSECDSGEQCRLQKCMPRTAMPDLVPDEPAKSARHRSNSSVCMTPVIACPLMSPDNSGTICFCNTASGMVGGIIP